MFNNELFEWYRNQILWDYSDEFKNISQQLKEDIIKIRYFLQNKVAILVGLQKLELALGKTRVSKNINHNHFLTSNDTKNHKILSDTFKKSWLPNTAFSSHVPKITELLYTSEFFQHLRNKELFKDVGAPLTHGEWTHFIQWYLIKNNEELIKALFHTPEQIYSMLGSQPVKKGEFQIDTLWDITCDALYLPDTLLYEDFDFSYPQCVMEFILASKEIFPLLFTCINKRMAKRESENKNENMTMTLSM